MPMKCAGRPFFGVDRKLSQTVASAGQRVKATSSVSAGSRSSQGMTGARIAFTPRRSSKLSAGGPSALEVLEDAGRLALRIAHRVGRRLRAGQRRLQPVVERRRDALVVVGGELGDRVLQLVARNE